MQQSPQAYKRRRRRVLGRSPSSSSMIKIRAARMSLVPRAACSPCHSLLMRASNSPSKDSARREDEHGHEVVGSGLALEHTEVHTAPGAELVYSLQEAVHVFG
eukprot:904662-Rhodomonas_salina.2